MRNFVVNYRCEETIVRDGSSDAIEKRIRKRLPNSATRILEIRLERLFSRKIDRGGEYTGSSFHLLRYINYRREGGTIDDIREKYFTNINQVESNSYNFIIRTFEEKMRRIKTNLYL